MRKLILAASLLALSAPAYCNGTIKKPIRKPLPQECTKPVGKIKAPEFKASSLTFKICGVTSVNHYIHSMSQKDQNDGKGRGTHLAVEDSRLNFDVESTYANHEFGYLIGLTGNAENGNNPVEENRIKVKGNWGTLLAGDTRSASDFMAVDTLYFAGGTGGVLGNYKGVINETTGTVLKTDLLDKLTPKDQTKVIYVSPTFYGFQAGYTYIPDGAHKGEQKLASHTPSSDGIKTISDSRLSGQNFHEMVLKYKVMPTQKLSVDCSGSVIFGKMRNLKGEFANAVQAERALSGITTDTSIDRRDLRSYATGLVVSYNGFSVGTEFVNNGKSAQLKILQGADMGKVWTVGAGYSNELNKISLTYFSSKRNLGSINSVKFGSAKARNIALTFDRQILPGMTIYAEGMFLNHKNSSDANLNDWNKALNGFNGDVVKSNKGKVLVTGTRIKF